MRKYFSIKIIGRLLGICSLAIALVVFTLILNWFFKITPYQKLEGMPLLVAPITSILGLVFGFFSILISSDRLGKWGIITNVILFTLPFIYWYLGTIFWGP